MNDKIAQLITVLFHPLLIPTYAFLILLNLPVYISLVIPDKARWMIIGLVFLTTFVFPMLFIVILYMRGVVKSFQMYERDDRTIPYIITTVFFYLAYYLLRKVDISAVFPYFMGGATLILIVTLVVNLFWKISSHTIAFGGLVGGIIALSYAMMLDLHWLITASIIVAALIATARLKLNAHTPAQIYTGFLAGVFLMMGVIIMVV